MAEFIAVSRREIFSQVREVIQIFIVGNEFLGGVAGLNQNIQVAEDICNFQIGQTILSLFKKARYADGHYYIVNRIKDAAFIGIDDKLGGRSERVFMKFKTEKPSKAGS